MNQLAYQHIVCRSLPHKPEVQDLRMLQSDHDIFAEAVLGESAVSRAGHQPNAQGADSLVDAHVNSATTICCTSSQNVRRPRSNERAHPGRSYRERSRTRSPPLIALRPTPAT